jgi:hypothetical protein
MLDWEKIMIRGLLADRVDAIRWHHGVVLKLVDRDGVDIVASTHVS